MAARIRSISTNRRQQRQQWNARVHDHRWPRHGRQHCLRRGRDAEHRSRLGRRHVPDRSTHTGATNVSGNNGADIFNIRSISGTTTINGGANSDTFNVGSTAPAANGLLDDISASLTINGNDADSGGDWLYLDDAVDTTDNIGTLTPTTITGLGMAVGVTYGTVEHLVISLGSGADTFAINDTHGAATSPFQEDTI